MKFTPALMSLSALLALPTFTLAFSCDPGEVAVGQTVFCQIGNPVSGGSCVTSAEIGTHDCGSTYAVSTTADICGSDYSNDVEVTCDGDGNVTGVQYLGVWNNVCREHGGVCISEFGGYSQILFCCKP